MRIGIKLMMACSTTNTDVYASSPCLQNAETEKAAHDSDFIPLVSLFGVYFQIRDDLMNLASKEVGRPQSPSSNTQRRTNHYLDPQYTSNKGFAEDLTEGKFSFPVVHGIHADPSNRQIISAYSAHLRAAFHLSHILSQLAIFSFPRRRASETPNHADTEDPHHQLPSEAYQVFRIHPLCACHPRGADTGGDQAARWKP